MTAVIREDLIGQITEKARLPRRSAAVALDTILLGLRDALIRGERIELRGFGVFRVQPRKRGIGRNLKVGFPIPIPAGKTIRFKPGKDLRGM